MQEERYYNIMDWHNNMVKYDINYDLDKIYDIIIAAEINKLKNNTEFYLYDVIINNLSIIEDQCIRGNSPSNNY